YRNHAAAPCSGRGNHLANALMSALGQKRTWPHVRSMSALPRKWTFSRALEMSASETYPQGSPPGKWAQRVNLYGSNPEPLMSALGHKRTSDPCRLKSRYPA